MFDVNFGNDDNTITLWANGDKYAEKGKFLDWMPGVGTTKYEYTQYYGTGGYAVDFGFDANYLEARFKEQLGGELFDEMLATSDNGATVKLNDILHILSGNGVDQAKAKAVADELKKVAGEISVYDPSQRVENILENEVFGIDRTTANVVKDFSPFGSAVVWGRSIGQSVGDWWSNMRYMSSDEGKQLQLTNLLRNNPQGIYYYGKDMQFPSGGAIQAYPENSMWKNEFNFKVTDRQDMVITAINDFFDGMGKEDDLIGAKGGSAIAIVNGINTAASSKGAIYSVFVQKNNTTMPASSKGAIYSVFVQKNNTTMPVQRRWWAANQNGYFGYDALKMEDIYGTFIIDEERARLILLMDNNRRK